MPYPLKNLKGKPFGRWTVLKRAPNRPVSSNTYWLCRCECGLEKPVLGKALTLGDSQGCAKCMGAGRRTAVRERISALRNAGKTYTAIAAELGISPQRVRVLHGDSRYPKRTCVVCGRKYRRKSTEYCS